MYENILVPLDGSEASEAILPNVVRLARESMSKVVLLNVEIHAPTAGMAGSSWSELGNGLATLEKPDTGMKAYLDDSAKTLAESGIEATTVVATGRSGIPRLVLGSVADMVIRSLEAPVLVVRPI